MRLSFTIYRRALIPVEKTVSSTLSFSMVPYSVPRFRLTIGPVVERDSFVFCDLTPDTQGEQ